MTGYQSHEQTEQDELNESVDGKIDWLSTTQVRQSRKAPDTWWQT